MRNRRRFNDYYKFSSTRYIHNVPTSIPLMAMIIVIIIIIIIIIIINDFYLRFLFL